jgi:hypothetical protein
MSGWLQTSLYRSTRFQQVLFKSALARAGGAMGSVDALPLVLYLVSEHSLRRVRGFRLKKERPNSRMWR